MDIIAMIFNMVISVATLLLFLRFLMQLFAVDPYNPVVISTVRVTHVADVFARILPTLATGRIHLAALVLIVLLRLLELSGNSMLGLVAVGGSVELLVMTIISLPDVSFNTSGSGGGDGGRPTGPDAVATAARTVNRGRPVPCPKSADCENLRAVLEMDCQ